MATVPDITFCAEFQYFLYLFNLFNLFTYFSFPYDTHRVTVQLELDRKKKKRKEKKKKKDKERAIKNWKTTTTKINRKTT